jgi:hypothetical protein
MAVSFSRSQASVLCSAAELELFDLAQPSQLHSLPLIEIKKNVARSRTLRDKWRDVSRMQRRTSQAQKGRRQTVDNARSHDKALLLEQLHTAFVERLAAVQSGAATVEPGQRSSRTDRAERRAKSSAERMAVRGELKTIKRKINKTGTGGGKAAPAKQDAPSAAVAVATGTAARGKVPKKKAAKAAKGASTSSGSKRPAPKRKVGRPVVSPARKRQRARLAAEALAAGPANSSNDSAVGQTSGMPNIVLTAAGLASLNRTPRQRATKQKVAKGGRVRRNAHTSSANKRSQARRDAKS